MRVAQFWVNSVGNAQHHRCIPSRLTPFLCTSNRKVRQLPLSYLLFIAHCGLFSLLRQMSGMTAPLHAGLGVKTTKVFRRRFRFSSPPPFVFFSLSLSLSTCYYLRHSVAFLLASLMRLHYIGRRRDGAYLICCISFLGWPSVCGRHARPLAGSFLFWQANKSLERFCYKHIRKQQKKND